MLLNPLWNGSLVLQNFLIDFTKQQNYKHFYSLISEHFCEEYEKSQFISDFDQITESHTNYICIIIYGSYDIFTD